MEPLLNDQSAERVFLKIEEPAGPLDIGQNGWIGVRVKLMQLAAGQAKPEVTDQLLVVPLANPKEVHDVEIEVVQYLNVGRQFVKKDLRAAGKRFDIGYVLGQHGNDFCGKTVLAADVGNWTQHGDVQLRMLK